MIDDKKRMQWLTSDTTNAQQLHYGLIEAPAGFTVREVIDILMESFPQSTEEWWNQRKTITGE